MAPNQSSSSQLPTRVSTGEPISEHCPNSLVDESILSESYVRIEDAETGSVAASDRTDLSSVIKPRARRIHLPPPIIVTRTRQSSKFKDWSQLFVYALAELIGGFTFSLLSPFYTKEATAKGLTVSQTGLVRIYSH